MIVSIFVIILIIMITTIIMNIILNISKNNNGTIVWEHVLSSAQKSLRASTLFYIVLSTTKDSYILGS